MPAEPLRPPVISHLGPFRLLRRLGEGGFAPVWLAEETYNGRTFRDVAIKLFVLPATLSGSPAEASRWREGILEEARALCRVEHPNIVRFYALQRDDAHGVIGLVMERVPGPSLDVVLRAQGPFEERRVLDVGISMAWALAAVHAAGLVHRDVKPENIVQGASGYKLIDFGIVVNAPSVVLGAAGDGAGSSPRAAAQAVDPDARTADASGGVDRPTAERGAESTIRVPALVGTPGYIAPECLALAAPPTPRSDLYALGVTLFKLGNGRLPDTAERTRAHLGPSAPRPEALTRADAAEATSLPALIALLCDPDPRARPGHADGVARALERLRDRLTPPRATLAEGPPPPPIARAQGPLLGAEPRIPPPLAPLFDRLRRTDHPASTAEASQGGRALGELGLGVLRYAFALGMAALAAAPDAPRSGALLEQLRSAARPTPSSWCYLVRALHEALSSIDPALARCLAFAADPRLPEQLGALLRGPALPGATPSLLEATPSPSDVTLTLPEVVIDERARWLTSFLERAAELLAIPIHVPAAGAAGVEDRGDARREGRPDGGAPGPAGEPCAVLGDRRVPLLPWLPYHGGRLLLPEAPAAPGRPWRATDPASGERQQDPRLDRAVRRLLGGDVEAPRELRAAPPLVGRADVCAALERAAREAKQGRPRVVLLTGPLGIGRTRLLDAAVEQAGFTAQRTLRIRCSPERQSALRPLLRGLDALPAGGREAFGVLRDAIDQALRPAALPGPQGGNDALEGVEEALLRTAARASVALIIDDLQWADAQTLGLLRLLVERAELGAKARLLVVAAARDEPSPSPPLRALLGRTRGKIGPAVRHLPLGPLAAEQTAALARAVCPIDAELEQAVVRGSGGVPFFVLHALSVWRERGAIAWQDGSFRAVDERVLREGVPGVAELLEDRLASFFDPASAPSRAALSALAAVALHGGGLALATLRRALGEAEGVDQALEALVDTGILAVSGDRHEYGFAQEMVRQAALNLVRHRPWFHRLHRALLDAIAGGPSAEADAAFLAAGYEKLGARDEARAWLGRAMEGAVAAGLFAEAAALGEELAALTADPEARLDVELEVVRVLARARRFEEAKARLARLDGRGGALALAAGAPGAAARGLTQDVRRRIRRLEVARGLSEAAEDPALLGDADRLGDPALRCEARMALAGVLPPARAMALAGEAVALAEPCGPALEFAARVLRVELCHAAGRDALPQAEHDLTRALALAVSTGSTWQQIHIEGDLAVLEAELGRVEDAIARLLRLVELADAKGMGGQSRLLRHNLSTCLMRARRPGEAAETAGRTAELAAEAGDPALRAAALSLRAYALRHTGALDEALGNASAAEQIQRALGDRPMRTHTLLRRAEILAAMGREEEALADAREARRAAEQGGDTGVAATAALWEKLHLARRGEAAPEELARAVADAEVAGVGRRALAQRLMDEAAAWLARCEATVGPGRQGGAGGR
ncbi:protein kinase domain-containing protein [Sorangium sp. So ce385]|uniref:serine/threonine-protein kinase n=1 Tax=Sorangium sp. So ce385 TaxID=3133308 RepID=UPI003F5B3479